ncbi:MAG: MFS transporter [Leptospiraceae bacterium]|nr:MFS transporter [Leptospiraceae bacterium]MDW8305494.1 MFS transporter [Leptospiraceae bacterium]
MQLWQKIKQIYQSKPRARRLSQEEIDRIYPKLRLQMLEATFVGYAAYYLVRTNLPNAVPAMQKTLGYSQQEMGLILSATGLAYGIGKFLLGGLSDRANPGMLMPTGLLLTAVLNILFGTANHFGIHLFLWTLNGFVQGVGWGPCGRTLGHWFSVSERGKIFGIWNIAHNVGGGLAGLIAGYSAEHLGFRSAFYIPALLATISAFYLFTRLKDKPESLGLPPIEEYRHDYPEKQVPHEELSFREIFLNRVLLNPYVWLISLANFFVYVIRYSLLDWGPTYLVQEHGATLSRGGWTTFFYEIAAIPSTIFIGFASDKLGGRRGLVSILSLLPILIAFLILVYTPPKELWGQILLFGTVGLFIYPPVMLLGVAALDFSSAKAVGAAAGFIGLWGYLGKAAQATALAYLSSHYGWKIALSVVALSVLAAVVLLLPVARKRPQN